MRCIHPPAADSKLCKNCFCHWPGCRHPSRNRSRLCGQKWCGSTEWAQICQRDAKPHLHYFNEHGAFVVDEELPLTLQVTAKMSWLLGRTPPLDYVHFRKLAKLAWHDHGAVPATTAALLLGHYLK